VRIASALGERLAQDADRGEGGAQLVGDAGEEGALAIHGPSLPGEGAPQTQETNRARRRRQPKHDPQGGETEAAGQTRRHPQEEPRDVGNGDHSRERGLRLPLVAGRGRHGRPPRCARPLEEEGDRHVVAHQPAIGHTRPALDVRRIGRLAPAGRGERQLPHGRGLAKAGLERRVALKLSTDAVARHEERWQRVLAEARAAPPHAPLRGRGVRPPRPALARGRPARQGSGQRRDFGGLAR
jgi:hypothetical protein